MIQPQFRGVTYLGSKLTAAGLQTTDRLPSYRVTQHEFLLSDEDLVNNKVYANAQNTMIMTEIKEWSSLSRLRGEQTTVTVDARLGLHDDDSDIEMTNRMVLNPNEAKLLNELLDKAKMPSSDQIAGGTSEGTALEPPKPRYHVLRPDNVLEFLPDVKATLKEGLLTNMVKQWLSVARLNDLNNGLNDWIEKLRQLPRS